MPRKNVSSPATIARGEELRQHRLVQRGPLGPDRQDRLDLRREQQLPLGDAVVQGLDAEPVPREEQALLAPVPDGEREHALQRLDAALRLFLVEVHDGLGVAAGPVAMAVRLEAGAQGGVVVDLAVEGDPDPLVLVRHRLLAARDVHDGEAAVGEADRPVDPEPFAVRAAMAEHVAHALEAGFLHHVPRVEPARSRRCHTWLSSHPAAEESSARIRSRTPASADWPGHGAAGLEPSRRSRIAAGSERRAVEIDGS